MEIIKTLSPDEARSALDRLPLDGEMIAALTDPGHTGHKAATAYRRSLYGAAYPGDGSSETGSGKSTATLYEPPEDPQAYRFDPMPEALRHDPALEGKARVWFHAAGVPNWLARNLVCEWNRSAGQPLTAEQISDQAAATEKTLRRDWGDRYEEKIAKAKALVAEVTDEEMVDLLDRSGLANSEYVVRQLVALAEHRASSAVASGGA